MGWSKDPGPHNDGRDARLFLFAGLLNIGYSGHCLHAGPIIRGEEEYKEIDISKRQRILKKMMGFIRRMEIQYKSFYINKKQFDNSLEAIGRISKQLSVFIRDHLRYFLEFDTIKVYYDNGQTEVNKILSSVLNALLDNVEFKRVLPRDYRLFQVADFICTLTLVRMKMEHKEMSRSEIAFFENERTLRKQYLKHLDEKELR